MWWPMREAIQAATEGRFRMVESDTPDAFATPDGTARDACGLP